MEHGLRFRIGSFFYLVSLALLMIFIGSVLANDTRVLYLLAAAVTMFLGARLRRRPPAAEPTRFSAIRKANQRTRTRRELRAAKKDRSNHKKDSQAEKEDKEKKEDRYK